MCRIHQQDVIVDIVTLVGLSARTWATLGVHGDYPQGDESVVAIHIAPED